MESFLHPRVRHLELLGGASARPTATDLQIDIADTDRLFERACERFAPTTTIARGDSGWRMAVDRRRTEASSESYELSWTERGAVAIAGGPAGLFYAIQTLAQWFDAHAGGPIPHFRCDDEPCFPHRGVMLDISRDKVPTIETLKWMLDRLASWKVNQFQLYTEHTFAYEGHETVWRESSPLTPSEIRELDRYAADRFIELVPNQNSLGHFHRWLIHEPYRALAECPEGIEHAFSQGAEPFSLCPTDPEVFTLLGELYDQLLPHFASRLLNVGLDESFDIGRGRSAEAVEERGAGRVYLDFVHAIHRLAAERDHRIQLWGDIILQHPELVAELPDDAIALNWGYEANHPFEDETRRFADAKREFYVCPGTSSWNSFLGRSTNMLGNIASAARHGTHHGASGLLLTDWGDYGHWQPLAASWPGLFVGASLAWRADRDLSLADVSDGLGRHLYGDPAGVELGAISVRLGDVYLESGGQPMNGTPPFFALFFPETPLDHKRFAGCTAPGLRRASERYREEIEALSAIDPSRPSEKLARDELTWSAELARLGSDLLADRIESGSSVENLSSRQTHAKRLATLAEQHSEIWTARNRPGGQRQSLSRLTALREALEA